MPEMPKFKTPEELNQQVYSVKSVLNQSIIPDSTTKKEILSMSADEIKEKYPEAYNKYLKIIKDINNFRFPEKIKKVEYTEDELKIIREMLEGLRSFPEQALREKMDNDGIGRAVRTTSVWLPTIYDKVYKNYEMPKVSILPTLGRGENACEKIEFHDQTFIVKPLESSAEKTIAQKVSDLNIGPKQFESLSNYLVEEFLEGNLLTRIKAQRCTPEFMKNIGIQLGKHLKTLHENNILVNDQILSDDYSRSHLMVADDGSIKIIDFGASIDLTDFPNLTDEEVFSLIRTNPGGASGIRNEQAMRYAIKRYREEELSKIKNSQQLIRIKDEQLLNEGLGFLSQRLPNVEYLIQGLKESYTN